MCFTLDGLQGPELPNDSIGILSAETEDGDVIIIKALRAGDAHDFVWNNIDDHSIFPEGSRPIFDVDGRIWDFDWDHSIWVSLKDESTGRSRSVQPYARRKLALNHDARLKLRLRADDLPAGQG